MINYCNTKIYMLYCKESSVTEIYIGYTTMNINKRMDVHRRCTNNPANKSYSNRTYTFIRNNGGWENWCYKILEEPKCSSKLEAREYEKYWMRHFKPFLNTNN